MRNVAIIGADFVPSSLPPAVRIRFFARYLPEFGWNPIVLTTDPACYECPVDPENEALVPPGLEVIRTKAIPAALSRRIGIGDLGMRSFWHQWRRAAQLCRERRIDLLFIPAPPYVTMLLGRLLHMQFGIPYVIDYIDPWVTGYYWTLPRAQRPPKHALAYAMARVLEPLALKNASGITGVSQGTIDGVVALHPWLNRSLAATAAIPYGGEPADFDYLRLHPRSQRLFDPRDGLIHVCYVGAFIRPMFDTARALFAAVAQGLRANPDLYGRLRLHFAGTNYAPSQDSLNVALPLAEEAGIAGIVTEHPARLPYLEALQVLLDSHSVMVLGSDAPHYTASKVFPGILARRPLLTIFHKASSVVDILNRTRAGHVITYDADSPPARHVAEIERALTELLLRPAGYEPPTQWSEFAGFTTRETSRALAELFDSATAGRTGSAQLSGAVAARCRD